MVRSSIAIGHDLVAGGDRLLQLARDLGIERERREVDQAQPQRRREQLREVALADDAGELDDLGDRHALVLRLLLEAHHVVGGNLAFALQETEQ